YASGLRFGEDDARELAVVVGHGGLRGEGDAVGLERGELGGAEARYERAEGVASGLALAGAVDGVPAGLVLYRDHAHAFVPAQRGDLVRERVRLGVELPVEEIALLRGARLRHAGGRQRPERDHDEEQGGEPVGEPVGERTSHFYLYHMKEPKDRCKATCRQGLYREERCVYAKPGAPGSARLRQRT